VTKDPAAKALFDADVRAIKANLPKYDLGYWTVYSEFDRTSPINGLYMQFTVQLMYAMWAITHDDFFKSVAERWGRDQMSNALLVHNLANSFLAMR
jgi:hypothetical protein